MGSRGELVLREVGVVGERSDVVVVSTQHDRWFPGLVKPDLHGQILRPADDHFLFRVRVENHGEDWPFVVQFPGGNELEIGHLEDLDSVVAGGTRQQRPIRIEIQRGDSFLVSALAVFIQFCEFIAAALQIPDYDG